MIRAKIVAEGDVQKAGYRDIVEDIAVKLGVKGFVENLRDKTVCVVCEAEKDVVNRFVDAIKIKNDIVDVKNVKVVETSPATNEFEYFDIKYGSPEEELGERMVAAVKYAKLALHETRGVGTEVKSSRKDIQGVRNEVKASRKDIQGVRNEVKASRKDIQGVKNEVKASRKDIQGVKNEVKASRKDIHDMHKDMNQKFDWTAERYGDISKSVNEIKDDLKEIKRMRELFEKLVNHIVKK